MTKRPFRSGFCGLTNPADSHARCAGTYAGHACTCDCHKETPPMDTATDVNGGQGNPSPDGADDAPDVPKDHAAATAPSPASVAVPDLADGVYAGVPSDQYHGHRKSVSSTVLRAILPPGSPANWKYGERKSTAAMDAGKVAHRLILGDGDAFIVSPYDEFRSNEAKAWKKEQESAGLVVIKKDVHEHAQRMAAKIREHKLASWLFSEGRPEVSLFWTDQETGLKCRARYDWMRDVVPGKRLVIPDLKKTTSSSPREFAKSIAKYGYHQQAALYIDAAIACGLDPDPAFVFVAQEGEPPYLVTVIELDPDDVKLGRALNRKAMRLYAECLEHDRWPGHADGIVTVELPAYARYADEAVVDAQPTGATA